MNQDFETNQTPPAQQPEPLPQHSPETPPTPPAEKSKTKLILFIVTGIVLVAGLVFAGYYLGTQRSDKKEDTVASVEDGTKKKKIETDTDKVAEEAPEAPTDPYTGWQNYADIPSHSPESFNYKYPADWKVVQRPGDGIAPCTQISPTSTQWSRTISTVCIGTDGASNGKSTKDVAILWMGSGTVSSSKNLTVAGHSAAQVISTPQPEGDKVTIKIATVVENVDRGDSHLDRNGILHASATFVGNQSDFEAFRATYQQIIDSIELK